MTVGVDAQGRLYFCDEPKGAAPPRLIRLDPGKGVATPIAELAPRDRGGVLHVLNVNVAASGEAWAYSVIRRLSDLHVVTGLR
jgi:hypothetical protein